jgi:hypothetical protein
MTRQLFAIALLVYVQSNEAQAPTIECVADSCQMQGYLMCQYEDDGGTCCTKFVVAAKSCPVCIDQCDVTPIPSSTPSLSPSTPIPSAYPTYPTVQPTAKLPFWPTPVPTSTPTTFISQYTGTPSSSPTGPPTLSPTYFYERNYAREPPHPKTKSLKALQKKLGLLKDRALHVSHLKKHHNKPPHRHKESQAQLLEREKDVKRQENGN